MLLILFKLLVYSALGPLPSFTRMKHFTETHEDDENDSDSDNTAHFHLDTHLSSQLAPTALMKYFIFK